MKKYLIYLMMAAAVVMLGASCSPDEDHEPETPGLKHPKLPMTEKTALLKLPTNRKILKNRATIPILRVGTVRFWSLISVGAVRQNAWQRK